LPANVSMTSVRGDGSCLFHSISASLPELSANKLRRIVAHSILLDNFIVRAACQTWRESCQAGLDDFRFFESYVSESLPLSKQSLKRLAKTLSDADVYWGDHYALNILAIVLQAQFVIFTISEHANTSFVVVGNGPVIVGLVLDQDLQHYSGLTIAK
jgi:hypothetical protein